MEQALMRSVANEVALGEGGGTGKERSGRARGHPPKHPLVMLVGTERKKQEQDQVSYVTLYTLAYILINRGEGRGRRLQGKCRLARSPQ